MGNVNYLLIDSSILPDVYLKVIEAKKLVLSGEAGSVSSAVKMAGISRSAYYKYKDKIFEYSNDDADILSINAKLDDNAGVLSSVMKELYDFGANVLSLNQSVPVNNVADVTVTVRTPSPCSSNEDLLEKINSISGVRNAEIV